MIIIEKATEELEKRVEGSGCEEGIVSLSVDPDRKTCQFDRGACMIASYGGRSAEFVTFEPTRANTRVSFMFGADLGTPPVRAAACAIINVFTGFLCMNRVLRSCSPEYHGPCLNELKDRVSGKRVAIAGSSGNLEAGLRSGLVAISENPDIIIITADGLTSGADEALIGKKGDHAEIMFISPSTSGVAALTDYHHWCPYGKG
ncbi:MAG TPA: hypothetical protein VMC42_08510 [Methanoregulaceae archaeon]|nr:hypothetical protein [Methanoregulaceae archaeon]